MAVNYASTHINCCLTITKTKKEFTLFSRTLQHYTTGPYIWQNKNFKILWNKILKNKLGKIQLGTRLIESWINLMNLQFGVSILFVAFVKIEKYGDTSNQFCVRESFFFAVKLGSYIYEIVCINKTFLKKLRASKTT